jgi:hypothetical protein
MIVVCQSEEEAADRDAYRHLFSPTRGRYDTLNKEGQCAAKGWGCGLNADPTNLR